MGKTANGGEEIPAGLFRTRDAAEAAGRPFCPREVAPAAAGSPQSRGISAPSTLSKRASVFSSKTGEASEALLEPNSTQRFLYNSEGRKVSSPPLPVEAGQSHDPFIDRFFGQRRFDPRPVSAGSRGAIDETPLDSLARRFNWPAVL